LNSRQSNKSLISASDGLVDFALYEFCTNNPTDPDGQYIEQVWKAINYYNLSEAGTILIGDFNSNTIWDRKRREGNRSNVVKIPGKEGNFECLPFTL